MWTNYSPGTTGIQFDRRHNRGIWLENAAGHREGDIFVNSGKAKPVLGAAISGDSIAEIG
jgi:hypothetical protein